jgi:NAD(P)-dependent dehydrogenase (short-subunit alcohol dehydrogenase family)
MKRYRALLTGASGGIGREIAKALAPHCDDLVLVGRTPVKRPSAAAPVAPTLAGISHAGGPRRGRLVGINSSHHQRRRGRFVWLERATRCALVRPMCSPMLPRDACFPTRAGPSLT